MEKKDDDSKDEKPTPNGIISSLQMIPPIKPTKQHQQLNKNIQRGVMMKPRNMKPRGRG